MRTLIVNLYGAPGSGKSTGAAYVFAMLKSKGVNAELVTEFAKDKTWENSLDVLNNQAYIFGEQYARIKRLIDKVDVVVTDSPLLLSLVYNKLEPKDAFNNYVLSINRQLNNMNYYLTRSKEYSTTGRNQTEEESDELAKNIINMLDANNVRYARLYGCIEDYDKIVSDIINQVSSDSKSRCNKCGRELNVWDTIEDFSIEGSMGYGTSYDGSKINLHLCCECMEEIIERCVISPISDI